MVRLLEALRAILLGALVISLFLAALSFGQYSIQGMALKEIRIEMSHPKTYTRAFCEREGEIVHCKDKLVLVIDGMEYNATESEVVGEAQFLMRKAE